MGLKVIGEIPKEEQIAGEDWDALLWLPDGGKLLSAGYTSGFIMVWSPELKLLGEYPAHNYPINSLCIGPSGTFFSSSSDCSIKQWRLLETNSTSVDFELLSTLKGHEEPARKMKYYNNRLYSGDELGKVIIWGENGEILGMLNTCEEIWDMVVQDDLLITCRHIDVVINTVTEKDGKFRDAVKNTLSGKGPLLIIDDKLIFGDRFSYDINVNEAFKTGNKNLGKLTGHSALVNAMKSLDNGKTLVSGGGDNSVIIWDLETLSPLSEMLLGGYISDIAVDNSTNTMYVGGQNKFLVAIRNI